MSITGKETASAAATGIERKFVVEENVARLIFDLDNPRNAYDGDDIRLAYVAIDEEAGTGLCVRERGKTYTETINSGSGVVSDKLEEEISKDRFDWLWGSASGRIVEKRRYQREIDGYMFEVDFYKGALRGLVTAEVEFESVTEAEAFQPTASWSWLAHEMEVTGNPLYSNQALARLNQQRSQREAE